MEGGDAVLKALLDGVLAPAQSQKRAAMREQATARFAAQRLAKTARVEKSVQRFGFLRALLAAEAVAHQIGLENAVGAQRRDLPHRIGRAQVKMKLRVAILAREGQTKHPRMRRRLVARPAGQNSPVRNRAGQRKDLRQGLRRLGQELMHGAADRRRRHRHRGGNAHQRSQAPILGGSG